MASRARGPAAIPLEEVGNAVESHSVDGLRRAPSNAVGKRLPLPSFLEAALALAVAVTLGSWLLVAIVHVDDRFHVGHVSGSWMALVQALREGTLYPSLHDDGVFGGTRYMPLPVLAHTGFAALTREELVSGKVAAYLTVAALLAVLFFVLRRTGCSNLVSLGLVTAVLATPTGFLAATGIRGDALSVLIQLGAVALVWRSASTRSVALAGALSALAIFAKLSAVWALVAIALWLVLNERRRLAAFLLSFAASGLVLAAVFELASGGRMSDSILTSLAAGRGESGYSLQEALSTLVGLVEVRAGAAWLLLPFALFAVGTAVARRKPTLFQLAFLAGTVVAFGLFLNPGSDYNHLLDFVVLTALVVGEFWGRLQAEGRGSAPLRAILAVALLLGIGESYRQAIQPQMGEALRVVRGQGSDYYATDPLRGFIDPDEAVLSEDPSILVLRDERPVVLDASMLPPIENREPAWTDGLAARVEAGEFDKVVLVRPIEDEDWYATVDFGATVSDAIRRSYRLEGTSPPGYWIYVPRGAVR